MNQKQFNLWRSSLRSDLGECSQPLSLNPLIMGVLNITPDSFSDGGCYYYPDKALKRALVMIDQGVDMIDLGGESSRPGAQAISADEELARVIPVIEKLHQETDTMLSIDTSKPMVMREAVNAGAHFINDIKALQEPEALETARQLNVPVCLMHMQGEPRTMQENPQYRHLIPDIQAFFQARIAACLAIGIQPEHIFLDPGFGFGKTHQHNLLLLREISQFTSGQYPILLGVSRKSTIGEILQKSVSERLLGSLAVATLILWQGVSIIRTHDIAEMQQVITVLRAIAEGKLMHIAEGELMHIKEYD